MKRIILWAAFAAIAFLGAAAFAEAPTPPDPDQAYVEKFLEKNPRVANPPALADYATVDRYQERFLGEYLDKQLEYISNDRGGIAWGLAYFMISLNEMRRATGDRKYLDANLRCVRAVMAATDDKRGKALWTGRVVPAWGCDIYAQRGRAVFAVHTGIIVAPVLEFLLLAKEDAAFLADLGDEYEKIVQGALAALAVHDRQWRDGPSPDEGHYIGLDQEDMLENRPLPANRLNAMGWALWRAGEITGDARHRDRAVALGRYFRNRLTLHDNAYYWPYMLPDDPVPPVPVQEQPPGEDSSHGGLTMMLVHALADAGQVFDIEDLRRFARMVIQGVARRDDGILISRINGAADLSPDYIGAPSKYLPLARVNSEVRDRIVTFYLRYRPSPAPIELAQLVRYALPVS